MKSYYHYIEASNGDRKVYLAKDGGGHFYWSKSLVNVHKFKTHYSANKLILSLIDEVKSCLAFMRGEQPKRTNRTRLMVKLGEILGTDRDINITIIKYDVRDVYGFTLQCDIEKFYESVNNSSNLLAI